MTGRLAPLGVPNFRWFYLGQAVNTAGSSLSGVALAFAVLEIDRSATALGLVVASGTLPMVAFMLLGGAVADRLPRVLVLRGTNLVDAVVMALIAVLVLTDRAQVWELAVLYAVSGTASAIGYPAFHGMVPILLPVEQRKAGYLLLSQSDAVFRLSGPAISGLLVATVGPGYGIAVDAASYAIAVVFLGLLRLPRGERPERQPSVIGDLRAGWAYARWLGWVIPGASCALVFNALISGGIGVLGPTIAADTIGSDGWGLARSAQALGTLVIAVFLTRLVVRRALRVIMFVFATCAFPMLVLGTHVSVPLLAFAFLLMGAGFGVLELLWGLTVQEKVPEEMLSRIQSIDGFFSFVGMPVGELLVGPLAVAFGARGVELGFVLIVVLVALVGATRPAIARLVLDGSEPPPYVAPPVR